MNPLTFLTIKANIAVAMQHHLHSRNVVIAANQYNPSIFSPLWLDRHGIVPEDDLRPDPGNLYSAAAVQVKARRFNLTVIPPQLQFAPIAEDLPNADEQALIVDKVGGLIHLLPHTPFLALGLNYHWRVAPDVIAFRDLNRQLFSNQASPIYRRFSSEDARFGAYMSMDALGARMKLDIKPLYADDQEWLEFRFNFHQDLQGHENAEEAAVQMLNRWHEAHALSEEIVREATAGIQDG